MLKLMSKVVVKREEKTYKTCKLLSSRSVLTRKLAQISKIRPSYTKQKVPSIYLHKYYSLKLQVLNYQKRVQLFRFLPQQAVKLNNLMMSSVKKMTI